MVEVNAAATLFAMVHLRSLNDQTLIAMQVSLVCLILEALEITLFNQPSNSGDQMVRDL